MFFKDVDAVQLDGQKPYNNLYEKHSKHTCFKSDRQIVSRSDDIEIISYVLVYAMFGSLPWFGMADSSTIPLKMTGFLKVPAI